FRPIRCDNRGISSYGNNSLYVFLHGNPHHVVSFLQYEGSGPFDVALAADGTAWVSNSGGLPFGENPRSVAKYALVDGILEQQFLRCLGRQLRGLSVDSQGNAWVASQGNTRVYAIRPDGTEIGHFTGGGMDSPWDTAIDGEGQRVGGKFRFAPSSNAPVQGQIDETLGRQCPAGSQRG